MRTLTRLALTAAFTLPLTAALAQTTPAAPANPTSPAAMAQPAASTVAAQPRVKRGSGEGRAVHHRIKQFKKLDANHDGHVTPEEAAARPWLKRHFNEIDTGNKGYLTEQDVRAFAKAHPELAHPKHDKAAAQ